MWNRAALMEASMVAFIVFAWYCYVRAQTQPLWGILAALCALLAYFTKAAAVFFVVALGIDALIALFMPSLAASSNSDASPERRRGASPERSRRAAIMTLVGLTVWGLLALAIFVGPYWSEYQFYNWQMSVTRKPSYDIRSLLNRVTWFPIIHDIFTRMWFMVVLGVAAMFSALTRWKTLEAGERLLVLWVGLGLAELLVHDVSNERRFIFFIPALVALTALVLGRDRRLLPLTAAGITRWHLLIASPAIAYGFYILLGSLARLAFLYEPGPGVRLSAGLAVLATLATYAAWPRILAFLTGPQWSTFAALALAVIVSLGQLGQFVQWAMGRTYKNYRASVELATLLPPGTLVHGKLANGLALENTIRPIFVGREFGNYADRKQRDDVRYILTYVAPYVGYEGTVIRDVLEAYPNRIIIKTFDVAESTTGHDRAALIDKFGGQAQGSAERPRATASAGTARATN
jgi:hypothetical protein